MIEGKFIVGIEGILYTGDLRHDVFTGEYGMPEYEEKDMYDAFAHHLVIHEGDGVVATGRLILKNDMFLIGRIAVKKEARGQQYGDLVVRMLLDRAFSIGAEEVMVHSMIPIQGFYEKMGFKRQGEPYIEATIEHVTMSITQDSFAQSGCSSCKGC